MTLHLIGRARRPARRVVVASGIALIGVAALTSCGKSITIGSSTHSSSAPAQSAPAGSGQTASNANLQVLGTTAAQAGKTGTGGTVVGADFQQQPPQWVQMTAVTSPPLSSPHLININQAALYRFDKDTPNSGQSACNDSCATQWPPVTVKPGGQVYLGGINSKEVGAIKRQDGTVQLTVGGLPVYRFSGDSKPGDLNGQGVGGTWFAVGPTGDKVTQ